jgi:hypothetical protein
LKESVCCSDGFFQTESFLIAKNPAPTILAEWMNQVFVMFHLHQPDQRCASQYFCEALPVNIPDVDGRIKVLTTYCTSSIPKNT